MVKNGSDKKIWNRVVILINNDVALEIWNQTTLFINKDSKLEWPLALSIEWIKDP